MARPSFRLHEYDSAMARLMGEIREGLLERSRLSLTRPHLLDLTLAPYCPSSSVRNEHLNFSAVFRKGAGD